MTASLLHVVATRMFCKLRPWHDNAYINRRLDIFEAFTLPSLRNQTSQDFHWLLLVNPALPGSCRERLQRLIDASRNIHVVDTDIRKELHNQQEYQRSFDEFLGKIPGEYDYLLSSRIDSDDCWNVNYVELLQHRVNELIAAATDPAHFQPTMLTFPRGVVCYPCEIRGKFGLVNCRKSFWSASVDIVAGLKACPPPYRFPHSKARKFARRHGFRTMKIASREPMWLYLQHDLNFALTDTDRWFRWFRLIEKLLFRPRPFTDERLGLFGLGTATIREFSSPGRAGTAAAGKGEAVVGRQ
jgi:hypothetical protein